MDMLSKYESHLKDQPKTLLVRIFGLFSIKVTGVDKFYFIIMHNLEVFPNEYVIQRYAFDFQ